jgi:phosphoglycolate phosphatase
MATKLLLFDIDGTLLSTKGVPRKAMYRALVNRFGNFTYDDTFNFSGRTDWEIVEHLLHYAKVDIEVTQDLIHAILHDFAGELTKVLHNGFRPIVYPGIIELLENLTGRENVKLGLVTGNIKEGARLKLQCAGLEKYFMGGGYGDDSKHRNNLPPLAIQRAEKYYSVSFYKKDIWIIGDSLHDITCAKANQLRSMAVATGWTNYTELKHATPEFLLTDFSNVNQTISILLEA